VKSINKVEALITLTPNSAILVPSQTVQFPKSPDVIFALTLQRSHPKQFYFLSMGLTQGSLGQLKRNSLKIA